MDTAPWFSSFAGVAKRHDNLFLLASIFPAPPRVRETVIPVQAGIHTGSVGRAWIPATHFRGSGWLSAENLRRNDEALARMVSISLNTIHLSVGVPFGVPFRSGTKPGIAISPDQVIGWKEAMREKRSLNQTNPNSIENKGRLEEQSQSKPKTKPLKNQLTRLLC